MKKGLFVFLVLTLFSISSVYCADQWNPSLPAGSSNPSDLDTEIQANNNALDRLNFQYREGCICIEDTASQFTVLSGSIAIPNSSGTTVRWRYNPSSTTVTWSDLDTGSEATSTYYYIYAEGDTDQTTFDVVISTSSSAPSGKTYYRKIGWFYNDSSGDIVYVGNVPSGGVANIVSVIGTTDITTSSTTYTDMTDMELKFVSHGRPVEILFTAPIERVNSSSSGVMCNINIDGTDKTENATQESSNAHAISSVLKYIEVLSAGEHTIKIQWKTVTGGDVAQKGSSKGDRVLIVQEL